MHPQKVLPSTVLVRKKFTEYRSKGTQHYQPAWRAKLLACPGCQHVRPAVNGSFGFSWQFWNCTARRLGCEFSFQNTNVMPYSCVTSISDFHNHKPVYVSNRCYKREQWLNTFPISSRTYSPSGTEWSPHFQHACLCVLKLYLHESLHSCPQMVHHCVSIPFSLECIRSRPAWQNLLSDDCRRYTILPNLTP